MTHLKTDELVDRLYGLDVDAARQDAHLDECSACSARWSEMQRVKSQAAAKHAVSTDFLAAQRRAIYSRLGERQPAGIAWAPALAAAALLAVGVALFHPAPKAAQPHPDAVNAQLFADVYSMEQSVEPSIGLPIHSLFEENP